MRRLSLFLSAASLVLALVINGSALATFTHQTRHLIGENQDNVIKSTPEKNEERGITSNSILQDLIKNHVTDEFLKNLDFESNYAQSIGALKAQIEKYNDDHHTSVKLSSFLAAKYSKKEVLGMFQQARRNVQFVKDIISHDSRRDTMRMILRNDDDRDLNPDVKELLDHYYPEESMGRYPDESMRRYPDESMRRYYGHRDHFKTYRFDHQLTDYIAAADNLRSSVIKEWANGGTSINRLYKEFDLDKSNDVLKDDWIMEFADCIDTYNQRGITFLSVMTKKLGGKALLLKRIMDSDATIKSVRLLRNQLYRSWSHKATAVVMKKLGLPDLKAYLAIENAKNREMLKEFISFNGRNLIREFETIFGGRAILWETRSGDEVSKTLRNGLFKEWRAYNEFQFFNKLGITKETNVDYFSTELIAYQEFFNKEIETSRMGLLFGGVDNYTIFLWKIDADSRANSLIMKLRTEVFQYWTNKGLNRMHIEAKTFRGDTSTKNRFATAFEHYQKHSRLTA